MKKKLALLLSAAMVVSMIPATAFAVTTNTINRIVNGQEDDVLVRNAADDALEAPVLSIENRSLEDLVDADFDFELTLENAEWAIPDGDGENLESGETAGFFGARKNADNQEGSTTIGSYDEDVASIDVQLLSSKRAIISMQDYTGQEDESFIEIPLLAELTDEGDATVTIDPMDSVLSAGTYKFANVLSGDTTVTINDTTDLEEGRAGNEIEMITIEENVAGAIEGDANRRGEIELRLTNGFVWHNDMETVGNLGFVVYPANSMTINSAEVDDEILTLQYTINTSNAAKVITFSGLNVVVDFDDVEVGDVCEVRVSGDDIERTTLEVGTATDYGVSLSVEDETVPTFYSGRADDDQDTLMVTIEENISDSWLRGRKAVLALPDGVKFMGIDIETDDGCGDMTYEAKNNELEFEFTDNNDTDDICLEMYFQLSISPEFTGDITATLSGAAIGEEQEVVIGTAVAPITVEAETNEVSIDYRNVAISDITITEAYAGALEGDKTLSLALDKIDFDGTPTVEVIEGEATIDDVEVEGGVLNITMDKESADEPSVLKVSGIELYLDRDLPAGSYELSLEANDPYSTNSVAGDANENALQNDAVGTINNARMIDNREVGDAYFQNSVEEDDSCGETVLFDDRSVTVLDDYVEVITAGRNQDDSTFTTQIKVTIGSNVMYAGKNEIQLDVPAYISNGYTMLPVRAVTEALSNVAIVRWDDATRTVTITFGSRIISMTVGSSTMNINGVPVQMQAAVEITGDRAFIPLRDMGYALGLGDDKIAWDDATKTATLN